MKKTATLIVATLLLTTTLSANMHAHHGHEDGHKDAHKKSMQMKLEFDYTINLPILMRAVLKNSEALNLSPKQLQAIKKHKTEVMDGINPIMKRAHMLSKELKHGLLHGNLSQEKALNLSKEVANLKHQVLDMKIVCISFIKSTLTQEQFNKLLVLDSAMKYLNSPYNY